MTRAVRWLAALVAIGCHAATSPTGPVPPAPPPSGSARPSCRSPADDEPVARAACDKEWSVLIFMMADAPGLPPPALWNLRQMEGRFIDPKLSAASTERADVVVQLDVEQPPGIRRMRIVDGPEPFRPLAALGDYSGPDAEPRSPIVASFDEARAEAPPATLRTGLAEFLSWGISNYPARHYAVIVWGHGFGFRPGDAPSETGTPRGGIALDASRHAVLDIPGLRAALAETSAAQLAGRPFDVYLSDACLMQTIEVAAELAGVARYIGGAEAKLDPLGLPYRLLVPLVNGSERLQAAPRCADGDTPCQLAAWLPEWVRTGVVPASVLYSSPGPTADARENLTYSVLDARLVADRLVPAMHALGAALTAYLREAPYGDERRIALTDLFTPHRVTASRPFAYAFVGGGRDIGSLLRQLRAQAAGAVQGATAAALVRAIDAADAALRQAVLATALGTRYADPSLYAGMLGVSAWVPIGAGDYRASAGWFAASRFYQAPDGTAGTASPWGAWLRELFDPAP